MTNTGAFGDVFESSSQAASIADETLVILVICCNIKSTNTAFWQV